MLHEGYLEEPFPINISFDDIQDFYNKEDIKKAKKCYKIFSGDDVIAKTTLLEKMSRKYIENNFVEGVFAIIFDGYELLTNYEKHDIFNKMSIDLSHMVGMEPGDIQILAIPFDTVDKLELFGEKMKHISQVEYWGYGELFGNNFSSNFD